MRVALKVLKAIIKEEASKPEGTINLPPDHKAGMRVTKGGSMCANCAGLMGDEKRCQNDSYRTWHKSVGADEPSLIPEPIDEYCCDWWNPKE